MGTKGIICLGDLHEQNLLVCTQNQEVERLAMHSWTYLFREAYATEFTSFIQAILHHSEVEVTGLGGKMAVQIVEAGNRSISTKEIVHLIPSI